MDEQRLLGAMPLETATFYESWIKLQPQRAERFKLIVDGVVAEFRTALLSNPQNVLHPDRQTLPLPCVRYAETLIIGALLREMGRPIPEADYAQMIRAEIMLRTFYTSAFLVSPAGVSTGGSAGRPSYSVRDRHAESGAPRRWVPLVTSGSGAGSGVGDAGTGGVEQVRMALFHWADGPIVGEAAFAAWAAAVPAGYREESPAEGATSFTLSIVPPVANLVIAYPASIRELHSAVQQSTGVEARSAWINGPHSGQVSFEGTFYRLYQWMPGFGWEHPDSFRIAL